MTGNELYEQVDFIENPLYEKVITDLLEQQNSLENFSDPAEVEKLRSSMSFPTASFFLLPV